MIAVARGALSDPGYVERTGYVGRTCVDTGLESGYRIYAPIRFGESCAVFTISDDQTTCTQCGNRHFAIVSLTDPHVALTCLECGYVWNVSQPVEDESENPSPGDGARGATS
jgi:hypothetical protein